MGSTSSEAMPADHALTRRLPNHSNEATTSASPADHRRDQPPRHPRTRLTSPNRPYDQEGNHQGPWNPAHRARQPGRQARPDAEQGGSTRPQPTTSRSRNIEASRARSTLRLAEL